MKNNIGYWDNHKWAYNPQEKQLLSEQGYSVENNHIYYDYKWSHEMQKWIKNHFKSITYKMVKSR